MEEKLEKLEAKVEKLAGENAKLKDQNAALKGQQQEYHVTLLDLQARATKAEAEAAGLKKLLARDGPHDPITKYD